MCTIAVAFVVTPILIGGLGNEAYGIWSIVISFGSYYSMADLGLHSAATKYIAQFEAVKDWESVNKVAVTSLSICVVLAMAVTSVILCLVAAFPLLFDTGTTNATTLRWVVALTGLSVVVAICGQVFGSVLLATKRFDLWNTLGVSSQILQAVLVVAAIANGRGLLAMAWIVLFVSVVRQCFACVFAKRALGQLSLSPRLFERKTARTLLVFGGLTVVQGAAQRVGKSAGTIIVGIILGPAAVTFYTISETLGNRALEVSNGIRSVLMPVASQLDAQSRRDDLEEAYFISHRVLLAVALAIATVFHVLGQSLIDLWIGPGYAPRAYPVLCAFAAVVVVHMPTVATRSILRGIGQVKALAKISLLDAALTLILGVVLVQYLGIVGMACAILLSKLTTAGVLIPVLACRTIGVSLDRYFRKALAPGVAAAIPGLVFALLARSLAPPTHIIHVLLQAACIALATAACMFFVCLNKPWRATALRSLIGKASST
ncbi:MAG: oligosaccharide flippase family protein [Pirellulales bacterium]|nr:oligosaccharide flippase family protein [Pirellulales bacterium]